MLTRGDRAKDLASTLGARWVGGSHDRPPVGLDAAVIFAPVGTLVPVALEALDAGGTVAIAGIHLSGVPGLDYQRHLFREKTLTSVTANTRADGDELLTLAASLGIRPVVTAYPFERAPQALDDLENGLVTGAAVLDLAGTGTGDVPGPQRPPTPIREDRP